MKIEWQYPVFPDSTKPEGLLPRDKGAQACWYYYILCEKQKSKVGKGPESQIIVEEVGKESETPWYDKHYLQTGRAIATLYQMSLEEIFNYWPAVKEEAARLGLPEPHIEYMNPKRFLI